MWANIYRGFGFGGYRPGDRYLTVAGGSLLPKRMRRGYGLYFALQNSLAYPSYHLDAEAAAELAALIQKKKPKFIYGYSSTLFSLSQQLLAAETTVRGLVGVFTTADMLYAEQRRIIERALGATVYDNYGCPEAGVMSWECSHHAGYHYNMESCFLQVVTPDEEGAGRLISTNLTNYAFPIVRYDTGDIGRVERAALCGCGRSHGKVKSLLGRQRDILTLPSGRRIHGAFFNHLPAFYEDGGVQRYQIIQIAPDIVEVHVTPKPGVAFNELSYIKQQLDGVFEGEVRVELVQGEFRESAHSRKHRTVISDVDNIWSVGQ